MELSNSRHKRNEKNVLLDTSMLLEIETRKIDVFEETRKLLGNVNFFITDAVEKELERLMKKGGKKGKAARIAKELLKKKGVKRIKTLAENADDSVVEAAKKGMLVAGNDRELRKRIKAFGGKNIYLRKKKFIEIE